MATIGAAGCQRCVSLNVTRVARKSSSDSLGGERGCPRCRGHFVIHAEILDFELNGASILPLVDCGMEEDRAARAGLQGPAAVGEVPADGPDDRLALFETKLQVAAVFAHRFGLSQDFHVRGEQQWPRVTDAVGLEPIELFEQMEIQDGEGDLGIDDEYAVEMLGRDKLLATGLEEVGE